MPEKATMGVTPTFPLDSVEEARKHYYFEDK
jgi:hypothetical protein